MSSLLDPAALLWLLLLVLGMAFLFRRQRIAGVALVLLATAWWMLEITRTPARLLAGLERPYYGTVQAALQGPTADAIVVLGGSTSASTNDFSGADFSPAIDRDLTGIHLARNKLAKVLVLGGSPGRVPGELSDGELVKGWIDLWDLTKVEVVALPGSRNTRDEAMHAAELAAERQWRRIILVTSASHLKRAEAAFRKTGLEVTPVGCDFLGTVSLTKRLRYVPQTGSLLMLNFWLHEVVGAGYYGVRGWI